jgi:hypothetical protein
MMKHIFLFALFTLFISGCASKALAPMSKKIPVSTGPTFTMPETGKSFAELSKAIPHGLWVSSYEEISKTHKGKTRNDLIDLFLVKDDPSDVVPMRVYVYGNRKKGKRTLIYTSDLPFAKGTCANQECRYKFSTMSHGMALELHSLVGKPTETTLQFLWEKDDFRWIARSTSLETRNEAESCSRFDDFVHGVRLDMMGHKSVRSLLSHRDQIPAYLKKDSVKYEGADFPEACRPE